MYFCDASLFQSSESHDPSEIILMCWFAAQHFLFYSCAALHLGEKHDMFFSGFFDE